MAVGGDIAPVSSPPATPPPPPAPRSTEGTGALGPVVPAAQPPLSLVVPILAQPPIVPVVHVMSGSYGSFSTSQPNATSPSAISHVQTLAGAVLASRRGGWGPYGF
jgi:hypothetical protein